MDEKKQKRTDSDILQCKADILRASTSLSRSKKKVRPATDKPQADKPKIDRSNVVELKNGKPIAVVPELSKPKSAEPKINKVEIVKHKVEIPKKAIIEIRTETKSQAKQPVIVPLKPAAKVAKKPVTVRIPEFVSKPKDAATKIEIAKTPAPVNKPKVEVKLDATIKPEAANKTEIASKPIANKPEVASKPANTDTPKSFRIPKFEEIIKARADLEKKQSKEQSKKIEPGAKPVAPIAKTHLPMPVTNIKPQPKSEAPAVKVEDTKIKPIAKEKAPASQTPQRKIVEVRQPAKPEPAKPSAKKAPEKKAEKKPVVLKPEENKKADETISLREEPKPKVEAAKPVEVIKPVEIKAAAPKPVKIKTAAKPVEQKIDSSKPVEMKTDLPKPIEIAVDLPKPVVSPLQAMAKPAVKEETKPAIKPVEIAKAADEDVIDIDLMSDVDDDTDVVVVEELEKIAAETHKKDKPKVPTFNLGEQILAEQRKAVASRRSRPVSTGIAKPAVSDPPTGTLGEIISKSKKKAEPSPAKPESKPVKKVAAAPKPKEELEIKSKPAATEKPEEIKTTPIKITAPAAVTFSLGSQKLNVTDEYSVKSKRTGISSQAVYQIVTAADALTSKQERIIASIVNSDITLICGSKNVDSSAWQSFARN